MFRKRTVAGQGFSLSGLVLPNSPATVTLGGAGVQASTHSANFVLVGLFDRVGIQLLDGEQAR